MPADPTRRDVLRLAAAAGAAALARPARADVRALPERGFRVGGPGLAGRTAFAADWVARPGAPGLFMFPALWPPGAIGLVGAGDWARTLRALGHPRRGGRLTLHGLPGACAAVVKSESTTLLWFADVAENNVPVATLRVGQEGETYGWGLDVRDCRADPDFARLDPHETGVELTAAKDGPGDYLGRIAAGAMGAAVEIATTVEAPLTFADYDEAYENGVFSPLPTPKISWSIRRPIRLRHEEAARTHTLLLQPVGPGDGRPRVAFG